MQAAKPFAHDTKSTNTTIKIKGSNNKTVMQSASHSDFGPNTTVGGGRDKTFENEIKANHF